MDNSVKFGFIPLASDLNVLPVEKQIGELAPSLKKLGGEQFSIEKIDRPLPVFYLIISGGTEVKFLKLWNERKKFFHNEASILLAHPGNNSFPAALEILAKLQQEGEKGKIIYLDENTNKDWQHDLERIIKDHDVFHKLKNTRIGLIGESSDWLVASKPEFSIIENVWGPKVMQIDPEEFKAEIIKIKDEQIEEDQYFLTQKAAGIKEPSKKEIKNVVKVYSALKKLVQNYKLTSISVRCFDLVTNLKTTGCYAISKLNDDGINAGCEGDLVSTLGMIWANYLTDQIAWMANPARLDEQNNSIWLAHCTVPMSIVENYTLRSHFESGLGVGIQGEFSRGKVTILRIGGKNLEKIWISNGEIIETGSSEDLCRTQVKIKLHGSSKATDLLTAPLGNHIILIRGRYAEDFLNYWKLFIS